MSYYYIYKITNNINGKTYIGKHKYLEDRYPDDYESLLADGYMGSGVVLKQAFQLYGKENFTKDILVSRLENNDIANEAERYFISCFKEQGRAEYNITNGGDGLPEGTKIKRNADGKCWHLSEDTKRKMSESQKSKANASGAKRSEEEKRAIAEKIKALWAIGFYKKKK